jgi:hypothetical protein
MGNSQEGKDASNVEGIHLDCRSNDILCKSESVIEDSDVSGQVDGFIDIDSSSSSSIIGGRDSLLLCIVLALGILFIFFVGFCCLLVCDSLETSAPTSERAPRGMTSRRTNTLVFFDSSD